jgi:hypothetical protein
MNNFKETQIQDLNAVIGGADRWLITSSFDTDENGHRHFTFDIRINPKQVS